MAENDDEVERKYEEFKRLQEFVRPAIERSEGVYRQCVNGLWIGNAGAAAGLLSFMGSVAQANPALEKALVKPFMLFVLGLVAMGLGAACTLVREGARAQRLEAIHNIGEALIGDFRRPTEAIGLTLRDPRTIAALLGAALFVTGCLWGLCALNSN